MSERANALADKFASSNSDFIALVESVPDDKWGAESSEEHWSLGVVAHHVAVSYPGTFGAARTVAETGSMPDFSIDQIHASNAQHAKDFADVTKTDTVELLETNGAQVESGLRGLTDDQLDVQFDSAIFGGEMTVEQLVEALVIGHIGSHAPSIQAPLDS